MEDLYTFHDYVDWKSIESIHSILGTGLRCETTTILYRNDEKTSSIEGTKDIEGREMIEGSAVEKIHNGIEIWTKFSQKNYF